MILTMLNPVHCIRLVSSDIEFFERPIIAYMYYYCIRNPAGHLIGYWIY